jgi:HlyD family secretion protein
MRISNKPTLILHFASSKSTRTLSLLALLGTSCGCELKSVPVESSTKPSNATTTLDRVTAGPPVRKTLKLFTEQPARVEAYSQAPIFSKLSGYVESVNVDLGDKVAKGDCLIEILAPEYHDQVKQRTELLAQAQAQVQQAQAALIAADAAANSAKALVAQARAGLERAQADVQRWNSENQRMEQLVAKGSVTNKAAEETASQLQAAQGARNETIATIDSAMAREQEALAKVGTAKADIEAAKARCRVMQADIEQAETMLSYAKLVSPFDGIVTSRNVDTGHYVHSAGSTNAVPLLTIANIDKVRVFVSVPETDAVWLDAGFENEQLGDAAQLMMGGPTPKSIDTKVTRTSYQLDPQSRSMTAEMDIENKETKLLPGTFLTAKILLEERPEALTLPISAIVKKPEGTICCVVRDGKIQHRPIKLGLRVGDDVQILSGLEESDIVVLIRASNLQADQSVEVIVKK